ncbi:hypothetical protein PoB_001719900 [Plakobranchus ocellatus]|uniref:Uncharacterized protein n=1 Tax=Plakobranchus ocellatus TaxID=259542 RepID=A0AAV3Z8F3_9GAST|nr:hypothetical protein PoB_001719900 [Plakobranchus ocellatus]
MPEWLYPRKTLEVKLAAAKSTLENVIQSPLRVIRGEKEREEIVSGAHRGFGDSVESNALGSNLGLHQTEEKIASRVWWPSIRKYNLVMKLFSDASLVDDWPKALPGILSTSKHDFTKISAFSLMYRGEPKLPVELTGQHFPIKAQADNE